MIKLIIHILLFSLLLAQNLPNDVKWVINSKEYEQICKNTFNVAYESLNNIIEKRPTAIPFSANCEQDSY